MSLRKEGAGSKGKLPGGLRLWRRQLGNDPDGDVRVGTEEFRSRTIWSLSNAFTSAFKGLDPIPQFKATAKLGGFLEARFSQSF